MFVNLAAKPSRQLGQSRSSPPQLGLSQVTQKLHIYHSTQSIPVLYTKNSTRYILKLTSEDFIFGCMYHKVCHAKVGTAGEDVVYSC
jgi:hypothetical protein